MEPSWLLQIEVVGLSKKFANAKPPIGDIGKQVVPFLCRGFASYPHLAGRLMIQHIPPVLLN